MSELDKPVPPAGEEIHLPGGSYQPILLTAGITCALIGLTTMVWLLVFGLVLTVGVLVAWIRDVVHEVNALPLHDEESH